MATDWTTGYPTTLDTTTQMPTLVDGVTGSRVSQIHAVRDIAIALEAEVGKTTDPAAGSLRARLTVVEAAVGGGGGADRGERGYGAAGPTVTPGAVPTITCDDAIGYDWDDGTQTAALSATASGSPSSWSWDILSTPQGLEYLISGSVELVTASTVIAFYAEVIGGGNPHGNLICSNDAAVDFVALGFAAGDTITVSGSVANDGTYHIESAASSQLKVIEDVVDGVAGPAVTITMVGFGDFVAGHAAVRNPQLRLPSTSTNYGTIVIQCVATNGSGPSDPAVDMQHGQQCVMIRCPVLSVAIPGDRQYSYGQRGGSIEGGLDTALRAIISAIGSLVSTVGYRFTPTDVKTSNYTAVKWDLVRCGATLVVSLPQTNDDIPPVLNAGDQISIVVTGAYTVRVDRGEDEFLLTLGNGDSVVAVCREATYGSQHWEYIGYFDKSAMSWT